MSVERILASLIIGVFQTFAAVFIVSNQLGKMDFSKKIIFFTIMCVYAVISFFFVSNQYRFLIFLVVSTLTMRYLLGIKDRKVILYSFNTEALLSISEILISFFLVMFGINSVDIVNNYMYNLLVNILVSLLSIMLFKVSFINKIIKNTLNLFDKNKKLISYFYIILIVIYLIVLKNGFEFLMRSNYYINILFMLSIVGIIVVILKNESKYEHLKEENKQMLNYVTKYEKIITEQGKTNHEFKNQLMVIRGYAQMHSDKIIDYIDEVVEDSNKAGSSYLISQLNNFPDGGIKGLLYYKLSIMDDYCIKYTMNVESGVKSKLKSLSTNSYKNITKMLGVLLDNAIDASKKSKNKKINIFVSKDKNTIIFKIYNSYKGNIDIEKIGTGYTTKGKGHGYGLRLVNDIVNENNIFEVTHELEDCYFVSNLKIKIEK